MAVVIGILAIAWGVVFVVLALATRKATEELPGESSPASGDPAVHPGRDDRLRTDLVAPRRDPYAVT